MTLFVDTNVLIDLIYKREPFYKDAAILFSLAENKKINLAISGLTFVNTFYVVSKNNNSVRVLDALKKIRILSVI
jgi:predicted nucleic acid-binding protein